MTETTTRVRLASPVRCYRCGEMIPDGAQAIAVQYQDGWTHRHTPDCKGGAFIIKRSAEVDLVIAALEYEKKVSNTEHTK